MSFSPLKGILKRIVSRSPGAGVAASSSSISSASLVHKTSVEGNNSNNSTSTANSVSSASSVAGDAMKGLVTKFSDTFLSEFQEKDWRCHCGHVFRAAGEWSPCEPVRCEAPGCPCPTFFLEGPGRELLRNGKVPPPIAAALPAPSSYSQQTAGARKPPSCGGNRFK